MAGKGNQNRAAAGSTDAAGQKTGGQFTKKTSGMNAPNMKPEKPGDVHRKAAADYAKREQESWERSDTDGFVSQWALQSLRREELMKADLADRGGVDTFPILVDKETGEVVPSRLMETRYGMAWAVFDTAEDANSHSSTVQKWVSTSDKAVAKKGYEVKYQQRPAKVVTTGRGRGLSGALSVSSIVIPDDGMLFDPDAPVVDTED